MEKLRSILITDRTQQDVKRAESLLSLFGENGVWSGSQAEREELDDSKGVYTPVDVNRVLRACSWLAGRLEKYGYSVPGEYFPAALIYAEADPPWGGEVKSAFGYRGEMVSVSASPDAGFEFNAWKEREKIVSDKPEYSFLADHDMELVAEFVASGGSTLGVIGIGNIGYAQIGIGTKGE